MTKVLIYAYSQKIYSSRQIAKALTENIPFMWIAARQQPDFRTINRFRSERMKDVLETVFAAVLDLLVKEGYIKLEHYFLDGTKIEANANRYTFVWKKAVDKHHAKLQEKVKDLFEKIEELEKEEDRQYAVRIFRNVKALLRPSTWRRPYSNWSQSSRRNQKTKH